MSPLVIDTPHGPAHAHLHPVDAPRAGLVLGHGAGGGIGAGDLVRISETAQEQGVSVALVEQPYRVAGRRAPAPARQLDAAWGAVIARLREHELAGLPLIVGGRSSGARVACRTAEATGAVGVVCLAFPLLPPGRKRTPVSRLPELDAVPVPALVVQGLRDPFGMPPEGPGRTIATVAGDHSLRSQHATIAAAFSDWLATVVPGGPARG